MLGKKCFKCALDEMLGEKCFLVLLRRNVRSKVLFSASETKGSVKSAFKVHFRRNARSIVILKCF